MSDYALRPIYRRSSEVAEITGFSQGALRDLRRRKKKNKVAEKNVGWLNASAFDLAKLLFAKTLRDSGMKWGTAWDRANKPEIIGNIVLHALDLPGAVDLTAGDEALREDPSIRSKWQFDFVEGLIKGRSKSSSMNSVGGGDFYIFGASIPAEQFSRIEDAIESGKKRGRPLDMHVVFLRELSQALVDQAGELALLERID